MKQHFIPAAFACCVLGFSILAAAPSIARSDDTATPEQVARWIKHLSSEDFAIRRAAVDELVRQGDSAVDAVAEAVRDGDRETSLSGFEVLSRLLESDDEATRAKVTEALKTLADSKDAAIVQRARGLLEKPEDVDQLRARNPALGAGQFQIQIRAAGAAFNQNGKRQVRTEEDGKKIEIDETPGDGIVVRVTETVDGKEKKTEVKARNLAELKQKDPTAFQLYRKHMLAAGGPQAGNVQAFAFGGNQKQVTVTNVNGQRTIKATENGKQVEITDRDGKDITVRVEEEVNGQKKTSEFKGNDLDDLKQKHPDAAKLYEEYSQQPQGVQIQAVFNAFPAFPAPAAAPGVAQAGQSIERALDDLAEARKQLEELKAKDNADKEALDGLAQRLNAAEKSLFEAQAKLGK